jgi:DNA-binding NtrC family response regulator
MACWPRALVACCECGHRQMLVKILAGCGLNPVVAASTREAVSMLGVESLCVAFCQDDLPDDGFKAVLKASQQGAVPMVICSRLADPERYLESMQLGAFDFISSPYHSPEVSALAKAMLGRFPSQTATSNSNNLRMET